MLTEIERMARLNPPQGKVKFILDTDTFNEVDDQFALIYALLSPDKLDVQAVYAAPFFNENSSGPEDGMEKSYNEIQRIFGLLHMDTEGVVKRGSRRYMQYGDDSVPSEAADDLIARVRALPEGELMYVAAIGAITNIASAIVKAPDIVDRMVVIWLGGNAMYWPVADEFNLMQDYWASRTIFDCGVPLIILPCRPVVSHMHISMEELRAHLGGVNPVGDYLVDTVQNYRDRYSRGRVYSKVIWDITAIAWFLNPGFEQTEICRSPLLTPGQNYMDWIEGYKQYGWKRQPGFHFVQDSSRHFISVVTDLDRDGIYTDLFEKIRSI